MDDDDDDDHDDDDDADDDGGDDYDDDDEEDDQEQLEEEQEGGAGGSGSGGGSSRSGSGGGKERRALQRNSFDPDFTEAPFFKHAAQPPLPSATQRRRPGEANKTELKTGRRRGQSSFGMWARRDASGLSKQIQKRQVLLAKPSMGVSKN